MENYVIIAVIIAIYIFWVFAKMRRVNELNSWIDVKGRRTAVQLLDPDAA